MASELTSQTMEQIYRQLEEYLHDRELRVTPERKAIVDAIYLHYLCRRKNSSTPYP